MKTKMKIFSRMNSNTPPFFRIIRAAGLALAAVGGVLVAAPVTLPAGIVALGGYLLTAGAVAGAVAQTATADRQPK